ncbi:MAG TPA: SurA N-terminal domain-containing protein [Burkholderiaceae bacterium]|jgi:peptidyl-prolyl cis-trans isomerase D
MFEFVRTHTRLFQFLLLIVILPSFALVGMQGYTSLMDQANSSVASVDGTKITQTQFEAAQRQQIDRVRAQNPTIDPKVFDTPEAKKRVLDDLVKERLLQTAADKEHLAMSSERALQIIHTDPSFAAIYNPDGTVNKALLAAQGLTPGLLEQRVRQSMSQQQVLTGVGESGIANSANATVAFDALLQQREVQVQRFDPKDFAAKINPSDAEIEAFYKDAANAKLFEQPENAQIQYVVLDVNALKAGVTINEDDLHKYYEENASRYNVAEERRASHILIKADKNAPAAERAKAKARAEALLAEARKNPGNFAELARKNSQDEGSAVNGGDLDYFGHGAMVKPFEDAAYSLKQGEISNVVESDFGYHIIQLTGIRGGTKQTFEQVRPQIEDEVRKQLAQKRFSEMAEAFTNTVYEQPDTLQAAADKFKLPLQSANVTRTPSLTASGPLASAKLLEAVFANDTLRNKRNTEAIETAPNQLVSARVVQYNPAQLQPLAQIKDRVRDLLVKKLAAAQAVKAGQERLAALQKGGDVTGLGEAQVVSRAKPQGMTAKVLEAILAADAAKLPAYAGMDAGEGVYVVARIDKLVPRDPAVIDAKTIAKQYANAWTSAEIAAYYDALKSRYKVTVKGPAAAASAAAQ